MSEISARDEWRAAWPLPVVAALAVTGSSAFSYVSGVFLGPITREFHWSRAQYSTAFLFQMSAALVMLPLVGRLVDRFGAKAVALPGLCTATVGFVLLGVANTGSLAVWFGLGALQSGLTSFVAPPVWMSVVVTRFDRSRGLALAIALSGLGVSMTVWPPLAAIVLQHFGWRAGFLMLAVYWPLVMLPMTLVFFRVADRPRTARSGAAPLPLESSLEAVLSPAPTLRSRTFVFISMSGGLFALVSLGLTVHIVPILREHGLSLAAAAGLAGLTGVSSIVGRVGTGFLLDRLPTRLLGLAVFLLPIPIMALLWERSAAAAAVAVVLLGLASGAEMNVVTYLAAKRFGQAGFASAYSVVLAIFAVSSSFGPILAGAAFDHYGSYTPFFVLSVPIVLLSAVMLWAIPEAGVERGVRPALSPAPARP